MSRINPEGQITRKERLVTVIAIVSAVLVHLVALFGVGRMYRWAQQEQKKERLMVVRRVRDTAAPRKTLPLPPPVRQAPAASRAGMPSGGERSAPPPPAAATDQGSPPPEPPEPPAAEQEPAENKADQGQLAEHGDNAVSVMTDLPSASFSVSGPADYRGSGTFWVRKGAPPGTYTVTFNPAAGFATPPPQSKELAPKGQIVFLGKYRLSTELAIDSNNAGAQFTVYRPDGRPLGLNRPGRVLLEDLAPGTYTVVFKDVAGFVTPAPVSQALGPGGKLSFYGEYRESAAGRGAGSGAGRAGSGSGVGAAAGRGGERAGSGRVKPPAGPAPAGPGGELDRRVQIIVKSYPPAGIDEDFKPIPYPEVVIRKSNFQQGWCQVYLVLQINDDGEVEKVNVERPRPDERARYEALIEAVERSVRAWDYDRVAAEVHVDVRFYVE